MSSREHKNIVRVVPVGWLLIGLLAAIAFFSNAVGAQVARVESVGFTVSDMDRAIGFYTDVLLFEKTADTEVWGEEYEHLTGVFGARARIVRLRLGGEYLELTEYLTPGGRPIPLNSRSNDGWFQHIAIIVSDMDAAYRHLRSNKIRHASTGPQKLPDYIPAAAGIEAFYFKDFDNHVLEILAFPPGKGADKWHGPASPEKLFLGIDHTAIVVKDTDKGLEFYRDSLGLSVAGTSENYGTEQEHLNNVFGARLLITGLKTIEPGIAIEFLQYLAPTDGKPYPEDSSSVDLWHWQTSFETRNIDELEKGLVRGKFDFVSPGVVRMSTARLGFGKGLLVRDSDGHAVRIVEK